MEVAQETHTSLRVHQPALSVRQVSTNAHYIILGFGEACHPTSTHMLDAWVTANAIEINDVANHPFTAVCILDGALPSIGVEYERN
jgi:hypothetical protein